MVKGYKAGAGRGLGRPLTHKVEVPTWDIRKQRDDQIVQSYTQRHLRRVSAKEATGLGSLATLHA